MFIADSNIYRAKDGTITTARQTNGFANKLIAVRGACMSDEEADKLDLKSAVVPAPPEPVAPTPSISAPVVAPPAPAAPVPPKPGDVMTNTPKEANN